MPVHDSRIFISYSHQGNGPSWKDRLVRHLDVFARHHLIDVWDDERIRASQYWDKEIKLAMSEASVAALLMTPHALESEYIIRTEFPFLRERQQCDKLPVFPVICEECDWRPTTGCALRKHPTSRARSRSSRSRRKSISFASWPPISPRISAASPSQNFRLLLPTEGRAA